MSKFRIVVVITNQLILSLQSNNINLRVSTMDAIRALAKCRTAPTNTARYGAI